ncbi:GTP-binding protein [Cardiosporidium cionae]|uniref:GTP-binding protein n=1 Tax=Cardiosporidium cionae TaxID=476202 RepID=A0ABQ7JDC2_9APIC|nr:GTP-binding protein [Cardiosporidium cionae]|eukprot:KAF8821943.1 GTP-binding protein [Cardiosporidium cionae]
MGMRAGISLRAFSSTTPHLARPFVDIRTARSTVPPDWQSDKQKHYASILFGKAIAAHPVIVAQTIHKIPSTGIPQVAFVGRSNVGKSSLINALLYGKDVARTSSIPVSNAKQLHLPLVAPISSNPGRTRHLFTFDLGDHLSLVDLPGYGFAKVSKVMRNEWAVLIEEYFNRSLSLKRVVCLLDARRGEPDKLDLQLFEMLQTKEILFQVVLTKIDLLTALELHAMMLRIIALLESYQGGSYWPFLHAVSARHLLGIPELRCGLSTIASDHRLSTGKKLVSSSAESPARLHD